MCRFHNMSTAVRASAIFFHGSVSLPASARASKVVVVELKLRFQPHLGEGSRGGGGGGDKQPQKCRFTVTHFIAPSVSYRAGITPGHIIFMGKLLERDGPRHARPRRAWYVMTSLIIARPVTLRVKSRALPRLTAGAEAVLDLNLAL